MNLDSTLDPLTSSNTVICQCKDIPDKPIIEFLLKHKGRWCNWYFEDDRDVRTVMPKNLA